MLEYTVQGVAKEATFSTASFEIEYNKLFEVIEFEMVAFIRDTLYTRGIYDNY